MSYLFGWSKDRPALVNCDWKPIRNKSKIFKSVPSINCLRIRAVYQHKNNSIRTYWGDLHSKSKRVSYSHHLSIAILAPIGLIWALECFTLTFVKYFSVLLKFRVVSRGLKEKKKKQETRKRRWKNFGTWLLPKPQTAPCWISLYESVHARRVLISANKVFEKFIRVKGSSPCSVLKLHNLCSFTSKLTTDVGYLKTFVSSKLRSRLTEFHDALKD